MKARVKSRREIVLMAGVPEGREFRGEAQGTVVARIHNTFTKRMWDYCGRTIHVTPRIDGQYAGAGWIWLPTWLDLEPHHPDRIDSFASHVRDMRTPHRERAYYEPPRFYDYASDRDFTPKPMFSDEPTSEGEDVPPKKSNLFTLISDWFKYVKDTFKKPEIKDSKAIYVDRKKELDFG